MAINDAVIVLDFDGTCVMHEYPKVGCDIGAVPVLRELQDNGVRFILWTMRSGKLLKQAEAWFQQNGINIYAVNKNPTQSRWTSSPKPDGDLYIDDRCLGCPVKYEDGIREPYVDWVKIRQMLVEIGYLD